VSAQKTQVGTRSIASLTPDPKNGTSWNPSLPVLTETSDENYSVQ